MSDATRFVVHADEVEEVEGRYAPPFDEPLSLGRDLGRAAGSVRIGVWRERIPPGRRTSFTHAHSDEEEFVYVLEGECMLRLVVPGEEPREVPLRAGHAVSFPAGTRVAHSLVNRGSHECAVLVVGERRPGVDRVLYPEDPAYDAHHARSSPDRHWSG